MKSKNQQTSAQRGLRRFQTDPCAAVPRSLYWDEGRVDITEVVDQWYGPGYRYVKVKAYDDSVYILCFDEIREHWEFIMFSSARAPRLSM